MNEQTTEIYGNRLRLRVCGLCWDDQKLLLVNHSGVSETHFWSPPGGGVEFGESLETTLKREFLEETGLEIQVGKFQFGCEFIQAPLHAIELFFSVTQTGGKMIVGDDPELPLIQDVRFVPYEDIGRMPVKEIHSILHLAKTPEDFNRLSGFYRV